MSTETPTTGNHELEEVIAQLVRGERDPEAARKSRERMDRMREATASVSGSSTWPSTLSANSATDEHLFRRGQMGFA